MQAGAIVREGGSDQLEAHLGVGETRLRVPRPRSCQVLLLQPGDRGEIYRERFRGLGRAYVR